MRNDNADADSAAQEEYPEPHVDSLVSCLYVGTGPFRFGCDHGEIFGADNGEGGIPHTGEKALPAAKGSSGAILGKWSRAFPITEAINVV